MDRPLAERLEVDHAADRAADQPLDLDRAAALLARARPRARCARRSRRAAASTRPSPSRGRCGRASAARPRPTLAVQRTRVLPCDQSTIPCGCSRNSGSATTGRSWSGRAAVGASHAAARSSSATATRATSPSGSWRKRSPSVAEERRVAGREEAVGALAAALVLPALARERVGDLARGLLGREDERDVAPEDALEDGPDQRIVRAAEDDRVAAGLP